jgi:hypothetical protein
MPREEDSMQPGSALPDLLLRPLGDNHELQHIFHADIEARLQLHSATLQKGEDTPADAATWLATRPAVTSRRRWLWPLLALAVAAFTAALLLEAYEYLPRFAFTGDKTPALLREAAGRQLYSIPPNGEDNPLRDGSGDPLADAQANWQAHPDDPVSYYGYASAFIYHGRPLPPDYETTWKRLDPGNAFWPLLQARLSVRASTRTGTPTKGEMIALLHTAASLPDFHSYDAAQQSYLLSLLRRPQTSQQVDAFRSVFDEHRSTPYYGNLWQVLPPSLDTWKDDLSDGPSGAAEYQKLTDQVFQLSREPSRLQPLARHPALDRAAFVIGVRLYVLAAAACFLLCALILTLRRLPARGAAARLALCLRQLLHPRDAWPAALAGILATALMVALGAIVSYPWTHQENSALLVALSPLLFMLTMLVLMVESTRREVSRRTAFLGLRSPRWQARVAMLMLVLSVAPLVAGVTAIVSAILIDNPGNTLSSGAMHYLEFLACACYGVVVLWLAGSFLLGYAFPAANLRHRLIAARLIPPMLIASLVMTTLALALHGVERHLVKEAVSLVSGAWDE